jgi:hypothetical protein
MKSSLQSRLAKLEARKSSSTEKITRNGLLFLLPEDYVGERHVVMGSRMSTDRPNYEWCVFEEVPGPGPNEAEGASITCISYADRNI